MRTVSLPHCYCKKAKEKGVEGEEIRYSMYIGTKLPAWLIILSMVWFIRTLYVTIT